MAIRLAINGYGRIGRCILRALYESGKREKMEIVAINELADIKLMAHLTRHDSTHGIFPGEVGHDEKHLEILGDSIAVLHHADLETLPWKELGVDLVLECTGKWQKRSEAEIHIRQGAGKVLFSSPAEANVDATIVFGLNEHLLSKNTAIVSNASCTTNCICHVIDALDRSFGIESGIITTIHSVMNDQPVIDAYHHSDLRRTRSSSASIIPVETGLAFGIGRILPELQGRFQALSLRVPVTNVSIMQLAARTKIQVEKDAINRALLEYAGKKPEVMGYTEEPLVSCDYIHDTRSSIVDGTQTRIVDGNLLTVMAWCDNEWGYANRMLDTAEKMTGA